MIRRPLREDTRHAAAAAVVGVRDAYRSFEERLNLCFEAEEVGQHPLKLGLREGDGLYHRHHKQGEPRRWRHCMPLGRPAAQRPSQSKRDFPTSPEPRSLSAMSGTSVLSRVPRLLFQLPSDYIRRTNAFK